MTAVLPAIDGVDDLKNVTDLRITSDESLRDKIKSLNPQKKGTITVNGKDFDYYILKTDQVDNAWNFEKFDRNDQNINGTFSEMYEKAVKDKPQPSQNDANVINQEQEQPQQDGDSDIIGYTDWEGGKPKKKSHRKNLIVSW